jgi:hypothetical protein
MPYKHEPFRIVLRFPEKHQYLFDLLKSRADAQGITVTEAAYALVTFGLGNLDFSPKQSNMLRTLWGKKK